MIVDPGATWKVFSEGHRLPIGILALPGIITGSLLSFVFSWNNFVFWMVLCGGRTKTLPLAVFNFVSYALIDWGALMAASVTITLPVLVIAFVTQRYIIQGLTAGAVKG